MGINEPPKIKTLASQGPGLCCYLQLARGHRGWTDDRYGKRQLLVLDVCRSCTLVPVKLVSGDDDDNDDTTQYPEMVLGFRFFWSALSGIAGYQYPSLSLYPAHLTTQQSVHDRPNPALPAIDTRDVVYKRVPSPFTLIPSPLTYSRKLVTLLGEPGATLPSNPHSHLPSLRLFQPPITRVKPLADTYR